MIDQSEIDEYSFRRPIKIDKSSSNYYYPINELISGENTKVFTAVKFVKSSESLENEGDQQDIIENKNYCIKYMNKKWIEAFLKQECGYNDDNNIKKFFYHMKESFEQTKQESKSNPNILTFYDYIEEDDSIFLVTENFQLTLYDYIRMLKETLKKTGEQTPILEYKIRKIIIQIIEAYLSVLLDLNSLFLGSLFNSRDIYLNTENQSEIKIKFQHPFLANLMTFFKVLPVKKDKECFYFEETFASNFPPEVYSLFDKKFKEKLNQVGTGSLDITNLDSTINNSNFDMWALGYLLYEISIEPPYEFYNLTESCQKLQTEDFYISFKDYLISKDLYDLISSCLHYEPNKRCSLKSLKIFLPEYKKKCFLEEEKATIEEESTNLIETKKHQASKMKIRR